MKYRNKPIVVEAIQWKNVGDTVDVFAFCSDQRYEVWVDRGEFVSPLLHIETSGRPVLSAPGDWIIRGALGAYSSCSPDTFEATYELAEAQDA